MKYKGIIFDLDGVLCSTDRFHFEAWKQTAEEVGAPFDETINMKLRGVSRMESLEIILSGSSKTFTDAERNAWLLVRPAKTRPTSWNGSTRTATLTLCVTAR